MSALTPKQIVAELDKYIIGQHDAKRMVAIAMRNRWRRQHLPDDLRDEVAPKNIIMIGPTGVGKTEIARRLAKLSDAPPVKKTSSAPAPIKPVTARASGSGVTDTTDPRSVQNLSVSDWIEAERKRQAAKWQAQRTR